MKKVQFFPLYGKNKKKIYFFSVNTKNISSMQSWNFWYFQHIPWNIFGIHRKNVNILYVFQNLWVLSILLGNNAQYVDQW